MRKTALGRGAAACAIVIAFLDSWCRADGLLYQLPPDGSWVRFHVTMQHKEDGGGQPPKMTGSLKMSSVGQETVKGEKCRWIEIELSPNQPEGAPAEGAQGPPHIIAKVLLPEKNLQKGHQPLEAVAKGWQKQGDQEPRELNDANSESSGPLPAFLSGPLKDVKQLDKKVIDTKLGKLLCDGITANNEYKQGEIITTVQFETRLNEKALFGVVGSAMHYESKRTDHVDKGKLTLDLEDSGNDAKSSLPDKT